MSKYELFKEVITAKEQEVIEESVVEDNTEALTLAMQLRITMPSIGDRVRVTEDSVFDAGKTGIVSRIDENIVVETEEGLVVAPHKQIERLITESDLSDESLELAFSSIINNVNKIMVAEGVNEELLSDEKVVESMHKYIADNTYAEVTQADFVNSIAKHLLAQFPKIKKGIVESPNRFSLITQALKGE